MEQVATHRRILYIIFLYHKTLFKQLKKSQFSIFFKNQKNEKSRDQVIAPQKIWEIRLLNFPKIKIHS